MSVEMSGRDTKSIKGCSPEQQTPPSVAHYGTFGDEVVFWAIRGKKCFGGFGNVKSFPDKWLVEMAEVESDLEPTGNRHETTYKRHTTDREPTWNRRQIDRFGTRLKVGCSSVGFAG